MSTDLPAGWRWTTLGEIAEVSGGLTKNASKRDASTLRAPLVSVAAVHLRRIVTDAIGEVGLLESDGDRATLAAGDLLIVEGNGSLEHIGRVALWNNEVPGARHQNHIIRVRPREVPSAFLLEWLASPAGRDAIVNEATSAAGLYTLSLSKVERLPVPIPPSGEQHRIVARLGSLSARRRRAKASLDAVPSLLDKVRQSILAAAFRGDLTADWRAKNPDVEPADKLLALIRAERRARWEAAELAKREGRGRSLSGDKWKARYKEPEPFGQDEHELHLPSIPASWAWTTLGHIAWSVKDGPHFSPKYSESGVPFISGGNVRPDGVDFSSAKHISPELHAELAQRCVPERGDLLYTKGGTTGIARVNTYSHAFNVWVHVAVVKLVPSVAPFFLQHALNSPFCYGQAQRYTHGVGNQDLGLTRMVRIALPLPPREEQEELARRIDLAMNRLDRLSGAVSQARQNGKWLEQSILERAFRGELVPQDPSDEPAAVLLERIRAVRDSAATGGARSGPLTAEDVSAEAGECDVPAPPLRSTSTQPSANGISNLNQDAILDEV